MIKTYWQQLSQRERIMVVTGASVLIITLLYLLVWQPISQGIVREQDNLKLYSEQLSTMRQQVVEIRQLQRGARGQRVTDSSSLLSLVDRTAAQQQIKGSLNKIQPDGDDGVRLWLDSANFDQMMGWLSLLERQHGVYVTDISIEHDDIPGRVTSRILLRIVQ